MWWFHIFLIVVTVIVIIFIIGTLIYASIVYADSLITGFPSDGQEFSLAMVEVGQYYHLKMPSDAQSPNYILSNPEIITPNLTQGLEGTIQTLNEDLTIDLYLSTATMETLASQGLISSEPYAIKTDTMFSFYGFQE